jgi:hypothetical protein
MFNETVRLVLLLTAELTLCFAGYLHKVQGCRDKECTQNFDGKISWKTTTWNTEKEIIMYIIKTDFRVPGFVNAIGSRSCPMEGFSISGAEALCSGAAEFSYSV